jgi:sigma-B regulation protein RsbU (phosphoserine phosphatase)
MSSTMPEPQGSATPPGPLSADRTIGEALAAWRARGGQAEDAVTVIGSDGEPVADLFFAPPDVARQLDVAKEVQQRLLPRAVPTVPGWEFAGRYASAGKVGGDYWSVKYYREENVVTCKLADVTGHGIASAILMAAVKFVSGVLFRYSPSPAAVMERTNHSLLRETNPDKMATMIYAWVYPDTSRVRLVNAGHAPAFRCRAEDGAIEDIPPTGPLLGLVETTYDEIDTSLAPGDLLFFCSDGVAEAGDPALFGEERVKEIVAAHRHGSADEIADAVFVAAKACCGPAPDDMSLLVIKAGPEEPEKSALALTLVVDAPRAGLL